MKMMNYVKCSKNGSKVPGKCRDGREWLGSRKSSEEEEKKVKLADNVIYNNGTLEELRESVDRTLRSYGL